MTRISHPDRILHEMIREEGIQLGLNDITAMRAYYSNWVNFLTPESFKTAVRKFKNGTLEMLERPDF